MCEIQVFLHWPSCSRTIVNGSSWGKPNLFLAVEVKSFKDEAVIPLRLSLAWSIILYGEAAEAWVAIAVSDILKLCAGYSRLFERHSI